MMLLPLMLIAHSPPVSAFSWRDMWQRPDQQARAELDAGHAKQAQTLARDPALRGAAAYRAADFDAAAQDFASRSDAEAAYNRGNALAKQKQYEQAIAAYDQALRIEPGMEDAQTNKKAVQDWLKKQQQSQQQNQQNQQDSQNQQNQNSQQQQQQSASSGDQQKNDSRQAQSNAQDKMQDPAKSQQHGDSKDQSGAQPESEKSAQAQQAEQNYREKMTKELAQSQAKPAEQKPIRLGAREGDAKQDEHAQAVEQWLQRVPDDPGGLLRRKFQLEYQLRQHGGRAREDGR